VQRCDLLNEMLKVNNGILKTSDVVQTGISKPCFMSFVKSTGLEKVSHGVYMAHDAWADEMFLLQTRFNSAVFSHETALYLLDLAGREPLQYTVTVKSGYNYSTMTNEGVKVYSIKSELHSLGLTTLQSPTGRALRAYNAERTICDMIRSRSNVEIQDFQAALKTYARQKEKDLPQLLRYAKAFHIEKPLRQYMEVLI